MLTGYHNESGIQDNLDIFPFIKEKAYLNAHSSPLPARAYLAMCAERDVRGIVKLLKVIQEDSGDEDMSPGDLMRYQDRLDANKTGLHMAIEKEQQEVVLLLLWLARALWVGFSGRGVSCDGCRERNSARSRCQEFEE